MTQVNRATSQNLRQQALQEGLAPLKAWVKGMLDGVLASHMNAPDLEFTWVGDDAVVPLQQAQTLSILVKAGIKTREEARADLGLTGAAPALGGEMGKFNPYHDERGRFATGPGEGEAGGHGAGPTQAPSTTSDVGSFGGDAGDDSLISPSLSTSANSAIDPDAITYFIPAAAEEEELRPESESDTETETFFDPVTGRTVTVPAGWGGAFPGWINLSNLPEGQTYVSAPVPESEEPARRSDTVGSVAEAVAPNGVLPGRDPVDSQSGRNMPPSVNPNSTALNYVIRIYNGQSPISVNAIRDQPDAFYARMPDGSVVTYRPAGFGSERTPNDMATVEINDPTINALKGEQNAQTEVSFNWRRLMKYPENFALHLQSNLREIANDILSCAYFISGDLVGLETAGDRRWQYGSDLICRCIRSGLVKVWNFQTMCHDHDSFLLAIASVSPFGPDGGELWNATFLDQTEVLRTLLETFFPTDKPYDPKLNPEFVSELESLFEQHGVGWSSEAILQIRQPRRMQ